VDQWDERHEHLGPWPAATLPVALLPLRLETRFDRSSDQPLLRVRAYPDDLHLDSYEPELTETEQRWGRHYWEQRWAAGADEGQAKAAWVQLADRFGPARAAWVRQALTPENLSALGTRESPQFPAVASRLAAWSRAAHTYVLPDRLAVLGYRRGQRVLAAFGQPIPDFLPVGPDPSSPPPTVADGAVPTAPGLQWLVDYAEAERLGMAVTVPIGDADVAEGFDTLLVLGLRTKQDGAQRLSDLLTAQHYTDGLAFVPQGTPSNNTPEATSGYASRDPGQETSFRVEADEATASHAGDSNGAITAAALGLDAAVFAHIDHAGDRQQADARHLQGALWAVTWGYFLEQMLSGDITDEDLERTRSHYLGHVRARGPLPALRVGNQPYGLLPVLPLDSLDLEGRPDATLISLLHRLRSVWRMAQAHVPQLRRGVEPHNLAEHLLQILSMGAVSCQYWARPALPAAVFGDPEVQGFEPQLPADLAERLASTQDALSDMGRGGSDPVGNLLLTDQAFPLRVPLVQEGPLSHSEPVTPNYIRWLRTADYTTIEKEDLSSLPGAEKGLRSLLYVLLRHAVLLEYARCAHRILVAEGLATPDDDRDPALIDITSASTSTLGRAVDQSVSPIGVLRDSLHKLTQADHPEAARLDELRAHLQHLEEVPSARLRWLLSETLDLASHRLDAWLTAQATHALADLRRRQALGLYLGAYGVVQELRAAPAPTVVTTPPLGEENGPLFEAETGNAGFLHAPSLSQAAVAAVLRNGYLTHKGDSGDQPLALDLSSARVRLAQWLLDGVRQGQSLGALLGYRFERGLTQRGLAQYLEAFRVLAPLGDYYKLEAAKRARIETEMAALLQQQNMEMALAQSALDALQGEIDALTSQIDSKTAERSSLQSEVNTLNSQIATKQEEIAQLEEEQAFWAAEVERLTNLERKREAQLNLNMVTRQLEEARDALASMVSERDEKQNRITTLTGEINTLSGQITTKQGQLAQKQSEVDTLQTQHEQARIALREQIEQEMQVQIDAVLQRYRDTYLYPPTTELQAMEAIAAQQVVDGLILLRLHRAGEIPWGRHDLPPAEGTDRQQVEAELALLEHTVDAVSDVITAEALYQMMQGNPLRAGATLDAVASGEMPPPELEYIRTPRSGVAATHRLLVLFTGAPSPASQWTALPRHARAAAEPWLNAWAARLLGDPSRIRLRAELFNPETGAVQATVDATLAEVGLCPLDVVYGVQGDAGGEVTERVRYHLRRLAQGEPGAELRLLPQRDSAWGPELLSLAELIELARAVAELIAGGRALEPRDLRLPGEAVAASEDLEELAARADTTAATLTTAHANLEALLAVGETADLEELRQTLLDLSHLGLPAVVPRSAAGTAAADREVLLAQGAEVAAEASRRLARLEELAASFDPTTATLEAQRNHHLARLQAVLGTSFTPLVNLTPDPTAPLDFAASTELQGGDPLAAVTWLLRMSRVRERSARLRDVLGYAEAVNSGARFELAVAQFPRTPGERWVALPLPAGTSPPSGRVSLVAHCPDGLPAGGAVAGLLVDEWVEVIPGDEETTGLAFHFDAPATQPPHTVLLAVPPNESRAWDLGDLALAVLDTLELARLRAVDRDALAAAGVSDDPLPAIYLARNPAGDTVSTDFIRTATR
jgi:hypothetical protein